MATPSSAEIAVRFLHLVAQLKLYHWQTSSHARHLAADSLVQSIVKNGDKFVEVMQGGMGARVQLPRPATVYLNNMTDATAVTFLSEIRDWLLDEVGTFARGNPELQNLRDELLADVHQTMYLFTFA
jgi:hypothetical protein